MNDRVGEQYPFFQLARALSSGSAEKASKWRDVLSGIQTGELNIGDRTPVAGMPVWATPEIVRGGFATGAYAAGGSISPDEKRLAKELAFEISDIGRLRTALNAWHLTEEGLGRLLKMAGSGCFDAETPEETALLAVAVLMDTNPSAGEAILDEITPFFDRLRFYPSPAPFPRGYGVHVGTVGGLRQALSEMRPSANVVRQNATLTVWIPLYDRLVDLLAEPVNESWRVRAREWIRSYRKADRNDMSRRWSRSDGPFQRCRAALEHRLRKGNLPVGEHKYIDLVIARRVEKSGFGSERDKYRAEQAKQHVGVWLNALSEAVLERLDGLSDKSGIEDIDPILAPVGAKEARPGAGAGTSLTLGISRKVKRARFAPVGDLVAEGQITSPEVLAAILPQVTADLHASGFSTRSERAIYAALYRAFRLRRSLLLLDLQSQVRMEELPWASALLKRRTTSRNQAQISRAALREIVALALTHFPQVQFPNAMIEEMMGLARRAKIEAPLTRELAADIFMDKFAKSFDRAASLTIGRYGNALYGRYYGLPEHVSPGGLGEICSQRAGGRISDNWSVAWNGMVIEQQLILTSHNLATIFELVGLSDLDFDAMSRRCFDWICAKLQIPSHYPHTRLQTLKNAAYAWRQMIAFLSELEADDQRSVWNSLEATYKEQPPSLRLHFDPAMIGLREALAGGAPDQSGGQVFLGWTLDRHPFAKAIPWPDRPHLSDSRN
ncbi:MAG: hypothetical protein GY798_08935 [Hyphomicrobiales bacterium]|nr:hypothetical protein [Hyphomicrobiales bacterium]